MRVISGTAKGRRLKELQGMEIRPTTDKVKESLFNIIQFELEGRRVLDLFGGTGQLGIEALSRGSAHCTFVDQRRESVAIIRENLHLTQLSERAQVIQSEALQFLSVCKEKKEKFDVIFFDPPYHSDLLERALDFAVKIDILSENGIIICESMAQFLLPPVELPYQWGREYSYGQIKLAICRRQGSRDKNENCNLSRQL